jgi:hypothetical protein
MLKKPCLILFVAFSLFGIFINSGRRRRRGLAIALIILGIAGLTVVSD